MAISAGVHHTTPCGISIYRGLVNVAPCVSHRGYIFSSNQQQRGVVGHSCPIKYTCRSRSAIKSNVGGKKLVVKFESNLQKKGKLEKKMCTTTHLVVFLAAVLVPISVRGCEYSWRTTGYPLHCVLSVVSTSFCYLAFLSYSVGAR